MNFYVFFLFLILKHVTTINFLLGVKDESLIRIIVGRSEIDLDMIIQKYKELFNKNLVESVTEKTTGSFQNILKSILETNKMNMGGKMNMGSILINRYQRSETNTSMNYLNENLKNNDLGERRSTVNIFRNAIQEDGRASFMEKKSIEDVEECLLAKKTDEYDGLMKVCFYNHNYQKEINSMIILNHELKYNQSNVTEGYLSSSKVI